MNIQKNMRTAVAFLLLGGSAAIASAQYGPGYGSSYQQQRVTSHLMPLIGATRMVSTTAAMTA